MADEAAAPSGSETVVIPGGDAAAQQQQQQAAPAPKVEAKVEAPKVETTVTGLPAHSYDASGDAGLDVALGFVGSLGFGPEHPVMKEAFKGNFSPLEATLAALGDKAKGYENMVALGRTAFENSVKEAQTKQTAVNTAVFEAAGGEANWKVVQAWAGKTAEPAEKEAINAMLTAGPVQARAAAAMLASLYAKATGTVVKPANTVKHDASGGAAPTQGSMSRREYTDAVSKLSRKYGADLEKAPEYTQLNARYLAGRKQ